MAQRLDWGGLWIPPIAWLQFWACCPQPRRLLGSVISQSVGGRSAAEDRRAFGFFVWFGRGFLRGIKGSSEIKVWPFWGGAKTMPSVQVPD